MRLKMHDERALAAIERIERALGRIERAARQNPRAAEVENELSRLRAAHEQLRERVRGAIGEIDRLLATRGGGAPS